jgi:hypothetical protein
MPEYAPPFESCFFDHPFCGSLYAHWQLYKGFCDEMSRGNSGFKDCRGPGAGQSDCCPVSPAERRVALFVLVLRKPLPIRQDLKLEALEYEALQECEVLGKRKVFGKCEALMKCVQLAAALHR